MKIVLFLLFLCLHMIQSNKFEYFTWPNICDEYVEAGGTGKSSETLDRIYGRRCSITFPTFVGEKDKSEQIKLCEILYPDHLINYSVMKGKQIGKGKNSFSEPSQLTCHYRSEYTCGKDAISHKGLCYTIHKAEVNHENAKKICTQHNSIIAKADEDVLAFFVRMFMINDVYAYWVDGYGKQADLPTIYVVQLDPLANRRFKGELLRVKGEELHSVLCSKKAKKYPTSPIKEGAEFKSIGNNCTLMQHFNMKTLDQNGTRCFYLTQSVIGAKRVVQESAKKSEAYVNVDHFHQKCKFGGSASYAVAPSTDRNYATLKQLQKRLKPNSDILLPAVMAENWPMFDLTSAQNNKRKNEKDIVEKNGKLNNAIATITRHEKELDAATTNKTTTQGDLQTANGKLNQTIEAIATLEGQNITQYAIQKRANDSWFVCDRKIIDLERKIEYIRGEQQTYEDSLRKQQQIEDSSKLTQGNLTNTTTAASVAPPPLPAPSRNFSAEIQEAENRKQEQERERTRLDETIDNCTTRIAELENKINTSKEQKIRDLAEISILNETIYTVTSRIKTLNDLIKDTVGHKGKLQKEIIILEGQLKATLMSLWDNHRRSQEIFAYSRDGGEKWKIHHNSHWDGHGYLGQPVYAAGDSNLYHFPATLLVFNKNQKLENTMAARRGPIVCAQEPIDEQIDYSCPDKDWTLHVKEREAPICYKFEMLANCPNYKTANEACGENGVDMANMQNKGEEDAIIDSVKKTVKSKKHSVPIWLRTTQQDKESSNGTVRCLLMVFNPDQTSQWDERDCNATPVCSTDSAGVVCEKLASRKFREIA